MQLELPGHSNESVGEAAHNGGLMTPEEQEENWIYGVALKSDLKADPIMTFVRLDQANRYLESLGEASADYHVVVRGDQQYYGTPGIHTQTH